MRRLIDREKLTALVEQHLTIREIAQAIGFKRRAVAYACHRWGLLPRSGRTVQGRPGQARKVRKAGASRTPFGRRLRELRQGQSLSAAKVASLVGIRAPAYRHLETGKVRPRRAVVLRLALLYQLPGEAFLQEAVQGGGLALRPLRLPTDRDPTIAELEQLLEVL